jgi:Ca2+-transporting ATPase
MMKSPHDQIIGKAEKSAGGKNSGAWPVLCLSANKFSEINGTQSAGAFAHYAFFSLFPLVILFATITSAFIDRNSAETAVIEYVQTYIPITGDMQSYIFDTISGVVKARGQASAMALIMLVWSAMQFFSTLITATNEAWGVQAYNWWRLPLKSLFFLSIMVTIVLFGIAVPVMAKMAKDWLFPENSLISWVFSLATFFIPLVVVFIGLALFYKLAPRRPTSFSEVWVPAMFATILLRAVQSLFVIYLTSFATLNAIYGTFGGIMALLLWIYLCGCIFIFGACLCATQATMRSDL